MDERTISERILAGREAEYRLNDQYLDAKLDGLFMRWMKALVWAKPNQEAEILEAKRRIDAILDFRKSLKIEMDDGQLAQKEQEDNDGN